MEDGDLRDGAVMTTVSSASLGSQGERPEQPAVRAVARRPAVDGYEPDHPPRVGFFTDTSVCIGCKAREVACKEWNTLPMDDSDGNSTPSGCRGCPTTTPASAGREHLAARGLHRADPHGRPADARRRPAGGAAGDAGPGRRRARARQPGQGAVQRAQRRGAGEFDPQTAQSGDRDPVADVLGRLQARTHAGCLDAARPGRCSAASSAPWWSSRTSATAAATACLLPVRGDRPAQGRRPGLQVHDVLRPADRRAACRRARPRAPRSRSSSATSTSCRRGPTPGWRRCSRQGVETARLYGRRERRRRRQRGVLPAARRAGGLRPPPDPIVPAHDMPAMWKSAIAGAAMIVGVALSAVLGSRKRS